MAATSAHASAAASGAGEPPVLPEDVPVTMPELPLHLDVTTVEQMKAIAEPTRNRILGIIQNQPATAKQIATNLGASPGTIGHHLQVLEAAGLAQVVARRLVRGIVAKYYTRTARIFNFHYSPEVTGGSPPEVDILEQARDEMRESSAAYPDDDVGFSGFPHARLSHERALAYRERLDALLEEFIAERPDPEGQVYGLALGLFQAPPFMQRVDGPPVGRAPRRRRKGQSDARDEREK
jgi:DNA-binding transcriptional ArsR family regulator